MPVVLLRPNATISNDIPGSGLSSGLQPHVILSDSSFLTRVQHITGALGTLTRVGFDTYTLQSNERVRALRLLTSMGQTHPTLFVIQINNIFNMGFAIWNPITFPTKPRTPFPSAWWAKDLSNNTEWTQADINGLEAYIEWFNPGGIFEARIYDIAIQVDVAPQPTADNVTPSVAATIDQDRPRFRWNVNQEGVAVQNRYELKVFSKAVVEGVGFDVNTSEYVAFLSKVTGIKQADLTADRWPKALMYGGDYYYTVKAAVKFLDGLWWSEWSQLTPFSLNDPPVVDVLTPSGAVTTTNKPLVTWSYTDDQVNPQAAAEVEIYEQPASGFWGENILRESQGQPNDYDVLTTDFDTDDANTVIAKSGSAGQDRNLRVTRAGSTGSAWVLTEGGLLASPVAASTQYTAVAECRAETATRTFQVGMRWFTAAGALISTALSVATPTNSTTGWTQVTHTMTSPATAAFGSVIVQVNGVVVGEQHQFRRLGLIQGNLTTWHPGSQAYPDFFASDAAAIAAGRVWNHLIVDGNTFHSQVTNRLDNLTNFRTYVRSAHRLVDGALLWGKWNLEAFNSNYTAPTTPTMTAHTHNDRTMINLTQASAGGGPAIAYLRLERSLDNGETWETFRYGTEATTDNLPNVTQTYFDYEVTLFRNIQYRAFSVSTTLEVEIFSAASAIQTVFHTHHKVKLLDPLDALGGATFPVEDSWLNASRRRTRSFKQPMGRKKPIVIRGSADSDSFEMTVVVVGETQWDKLMELLANRTLYVQTPKGSWYADIAGDVGHQDRLWDRRQGEQDVWKVTIPFQEVDFAAS